MVYSGSKKKLKAFCNMDTTIYIPEFFISLDIKNYQWIERITGLYGGEKYMVSPAWNYRFVVSPPSFLFVLGYSD